MRQNPKARQAKSKARLARFDELSSYDYQKRNETQEIFIPVAERLGDAVIEFKGVSKGYGERLLIDDLSFQVPAGAIVGIIGPNGAGKSTLFRMITGKEQPGKGEVVIGPTVKMAYVDQSRDALEGDKTVFDYVAAGADMLNVGKFEMPSRAYLGRFNFKGTDQGKKVGNLSGGERGRLHLAKTLIAGGNVLLLDEPSNDLDVETLRALEDALLEFAGSVLVIYPRPLVPRPHRHPHHRLRRRLQGELLQWQLPGVRSGQGEAPGRGSGQAEADTLQAAEVVGIKYNVLNAVACKERTLRAARANRVFCTDEKRIRTENAVTVNNEDGVGVCTRSSIAHGWVFIRVQSTIRADGFSSAQNGFRPRPGPGAPKTR